MLTCYKSRPLVKLPHLQRALDVIWIVQSLKWPQVRESSAAGTASPVLATSGVQECSHCEPDIIAVACSLHDVKHNQM